MTRVCVFCASSYGSRPVYAETARAMARAIVRKRGVEEGFIYPVNRRLILMGTDPDRLLDSLSSYAPPKTEKWIVSDES